MKQSPPGQPSGTDILADVELVGFTATPSHIGPFGASCLQWEVAGPRTGFQLLLNGVPVPHKGMRVVQLESTTWYLLTASAQGAQALVGELSVTVDLAACRTTLISKPADTIADSLRAQVASVPGLYMTADTDIRFVPGSIQIQAHLAMNVDWIPDPAIEISVAMGLAVRSGHIVSVLQNLDASVSVPNWVWVLPGAPIGLGIALSDAAAKARKLAEAAVALIAAEFDIMSVFGSPDGARLVLHDVSIGPDALGQGQVLVRACPDQILVRLASLSAAEKIATP